MIASIKRAAELTALAEDVRIRALTDGNVDPLVLVRLDNSARRAEQALMIEEHERIRREPASLEEWMAGPGSKAITRSPVGRGSVHLAAARPASTKNARSKPTHGKKTKLPAEGRP